ncbi:MAG: germination protein YpeB [Oscillospiraceae bacterium]|nr:germination protein YpeB [Oscillospiraceae bacterium]
MIHITKRGLARLIAFPVAIVAALSIMLYVNLAQTETAKRTLENNYARAVEDLSRSLENIKNALNKGMYSNSPLMMSRLSSRLSSDASAAKANISQLPVHEADLTDAYKFLSQVGNYSDSLSRRAALGYELTAEDRENMAKLYNLAKTISENVWEAESRLRDGTLTFEKVEKTAVGAGTAAGTGAGNLLHVADSFRELEDAFEDYPMLIYDGPFSDHIMQKEPLMQKNAEIVSMEQALKKAVKITGITDLVLISEEDGKMPSYIFGDSYSNTAAVTKQGGFLSYMLSYRPVDAERITAEQAVKAAEKFLEKSGKLNITETYHEIRDGICIINFAGIQDDVTLYTDLIKVGVAMNTGEILSCDMRGYLTNHNPNGRDIGEPALSREEAATKLSPLLTVLNSKLCVIPSDGMKEIFCYEFKCVNSSDSSEQQLLVYINADTGEEERILLLEITKNGILTV